MNVIQIDASDKLYLVLKILFMHDVVSELSLEEI
jgi:hypothetical protein